MANLTSFDQMLTYASSKIAYMSDEFEKNHKNLPKNQLETMTSELKNTQNNLRKALKNTDSTEFDAKLVKSILSYINKIKKNTVDVRDATSYRSQKLIFLDALIDFQSLLKTIQKKGKETSEKMTARVKRKPVVKIEGIKGKSFISKDLNAHLELTEKKLAKLTKTIVKPQKSERPIEYKELITVLKKANAALVKAKAFHKEFSGKYEPDYNRKVLRKIFQEINFLQYDIDAQIQTGTANMQANLFWFALKEFQTLLQDLEFLKKTRGKAVANIQAELMSK